LTYYPQIGYGSLDFLFLFDQCKKKEHHGGGEPWQDCGRAFFYRLVSQLPKINFLLLCRDFLTAPAAGAVTFSIRLYVFSSIEACCAGFSKKSYQTESALALSSYLPLKTYN
jgi:hypothetical protein